MKKILTLFVAAIVLLMAFSVHAADWSNPITESPYNIGIIPVKETVDMFGCKTYQQYFGSASAGDSIAFVVRVEVPENPRPATMIIKGINATVNAPLTVSLPETPGLYYYKADGTFYTTMEAITAYCTGVPTIKINIRGNERVQSVGMYQVTTNSSGYIFTNEGRGVEFHTDAHGRIYAAHVFGLDYKHKVNSALMSDNEEPAAIVNTVLRTLGMDTALLLSGNAFMTDQLLAKNFGVMIDTEASKTWTATTYVPTPTTIPVIPAPGVPATGMPWDIISVICAFACLCAMMVVILRHRRP